MQSTCWPTSTGPAPATDPPKRSTAASNTSADPPSASATSPTTSPDPYSNPAASDLSYTLECDEPVKVAARTCTCTRLRAAMQRILDGTEQRTDSALTRETLAREAAVGRAAVRCADRALHEWNAVSSSPPPLRCSRRRGHHRFPRSAPGCHPEDHHLERQARCPRHRDRQPLPRGPGPARRARPPRPSCTHYPARRDIDEPRRVDHRSITIPGQPG